MSAGAEGAAAGALVLLAVGAGLVDDDPESPLPYCAAANAGSRQAIQAVVKIMLVWKRMWYRREINKGNKVRFGLFCTCRKSRSHVIIALLVCWFTSGIASFLNVGVHFQHVLNSKFAFVDSAGGSLPADFIHQSSVVSQNFICRLKLAGSRALRATGSRVRKACRSESQIQMLSKSSSNHIVNPTL